MSIVTKNEADSKENTPKKDDKFHFDNFLDEWRLIFK